MKIKTLVSRLGGHSFPFVTVSSMRRNRISRNRISSHDLSTPNAMILQETLRLPRFCHNPAKIHTTNK